MRRRGAETVTRLRGVPVVDPYSQEETNIDWDDPDETPFPGCAVWDSGTDEPTDAGRQSVVSDFTASMPYDADVTPQDRLIIRGLTCEVVGRPFNWRGLYSGRPAGRIVKAKIVEG